MGRKRLTEKTEIQQILVSKLTNSPQPQRKPQKAILSTKELTVEEKKESKAANEDSVKGTEEASVDGRISECDLADT